MKEIGKFLRFYDLVDIQIYIIEKFYYVLEIWVRVVSGNDNLNVKLLRLI